MPRPTSSLVAARQRPLRERFRSHPAEAVTHKHVRTVADGSSDPLHGRVAAVGFDEAWPFGLDGKVGGYDDLPNPGHLLCAALAACLDSTIRMLADRSRLDLVELQVDAVGSVDVRGCLALDEQVRPGFERISCSVRLEVADSADPERARLLRQQAERLCVTLDTLRRGVPVEVRW